MNQCRNCGSFVTPDFVRVFGDNEGEIHGCPACASTTDLLNGESAIEAEETDRVVG